MRSVKKRIAIGAIGLAGLAVLWNLVSNNSEHSNQLNPEATAQRTPLKKETDEERRIASAVSPIILSYRRELELNGAKFFTGMAEPEQKAKLLDTAVNLNSHKIRDAIFLARDEKCIVKFDIKARDTNDGNLPVRLDIDPKAGKITTTINNAKKYDYQISDAQKEKLLKAVRPAAKNAFNTMAPAEDLVAMPALAQLAAPVEAKQLPAAPIVRQIARRSGPMGLS